MDRAEALAGLDPRQGSLIRTDSAEAHSLTNITKLLVGATQDRTVVIDWAKAERTFESASGIPEPVMLHPASTVQVIDGGN